MNNHTQILFSLNFAFEVSINLKHCFAVLYQKHIAFSTLLTYLHIKKRSTICNKLTFCIFILLQMGKLKGN